MDNYSTVIDGTLKVKYEGDYFVDGIHISTGGAWSDHSLQSLVNLRAAPALSRANQRQPQVLALGMRTDIGWTG